MRTLYSLAIYVLMPLALLYLALRGLRQRAYLRRWGERFACYTQPLPLAGLPLAPGGIVVHAASVGEVNAAAPLIRALAQRFPDLPLTVTSFTPTGSERVQALFGNKVYHLYAPLDLPGAVRRFYRHLQPRLLVVMETEIWPNLFFTAAKNDIPILIANARISERSLKGYWRVRPLMRFTLQQVTCISAQSPRDAQRLLDLGAPAKRVEVTGNLKFDVELPPDVHERSQSMRQTWGVERPVFLAGSTHEGDEGPVLQAFEGLRKEFPQALLVLVPRHPERFLRAAQRARHAGLNVHMHSEGENFPPSAQCLLVDAMGELQRYYAACDVAFVGGSFDPVGGHNVLEPAALSVPVLVGPHTFNFTDITTHLMECGGALRVEDAVALERAVKKLLGDAQLRQTMGAAGLALVRSGHGALIRTVHIAAQLLE